MDWRDQASDLVDGVNEAPLQRLAGHLASRTERGAANQLAAGLAGLALAGLSAAPGPGVENLAAHTIAAQHKEAWFNEYGGPDLGYLSVTLDALVDYHDASGDDRALAAIDRAVDVLAAMVGVDGRRPSTLNSRNTDYVVPYGLVRAAEPANPVPRALAAEAHRAARAGIRAAAEADSVAEKNHDIPPFGERRTGLRTRRRDGRRGHIDRGQIRSSLRRCRGTRARQNLRHVASADSFSHEELLTRLFECGLVALDKPESVRTDWTPSGEQYSA